MHLTRSLTFTVARDEVFTTSPPPGGKAQPEKRRRLTLAAADGTTLVIDTDIATANTIVAAGKGTASLSIFVADPAPPVPEPETGADPAVPPESPQE